MLIIGDVHGKIDQYQQIIEKKKAKESVQVGDFGFQREHDWFLENMDCSRHKVLFGNHDYYPYLYKEHSLATTWAYDQQRKIFYVRGAYSIDWRMRIEGVSWWKEEEIDHSDLEDVYENYCSAKPKVVITHDCTHSLAHSFFALQSKVRTRTGFLLDAMFNTYEPDLWIFGHYHSSISRKIGRTTFRCLNELEYMEI